MYKVIRTSVTTLLIGLFAGCASLNPAAMAKLAGFDPLATHPADISVALIVSKPLRLRTGDAVLRLTLDPDDPKWRIDETVLLDIIDQAPSPDLPANEETETIQIARVATRDHARLAAAQSKARAYKAAGLESGRGSLSVSITGACHGEEIGNEALTARIFMKTGRDADYFSLTRTIDLRKLAERPEFAELSACAAPKGPRLTAQ